MCRLIAIFSMVALLASPGLAQNLSCICPHFEMGQSSTPGNSLYYASRHTGPTCNEFDPVWFETTSGKSAFCSPPANCMACDPIKASDAVKANASQSAPQARGAATQPPFTKLSVPVGPNFQLDPNSDGVPRLGQVNRIGKSYVLKVNSNRLPAGSSPKFVRVAMFFHEYDDFRYVVALGVESVDPPGPESSFTGSIHAVKVYQPDQLTTATSNEYVELHSGSLRLLVRVEDASSWFGP